MVTSFEKARAEILARIAPLRPRPATLPAAAGRVLAEPVYAPCDLPRWDHSAMDGFAVHSADCNRLSHLPVTGCLTAGEAADGVVLAPGSALRIMTGAPLPAGCDAVVPFENTEQDDGKILIKFRVKPGQHVRRKGEDIENRQLAVPAGAVIRPAEISLLASFGMTTVKVFRQARVAILATGDELVEPGTRLSGGRIPDSNSAALAAAVKETGAEPILLGIAGDDPEELELKIAQGLKADALLTSGGISAGDRDYVRDVLDRLRVKPVFRGVNLKQGRPTMFGLWNRKPIFALPGNAVSGLLAFDQLVRPALLKMMGFRQVTRTPVKAILQTPHTKKSNRVELLRVTITRHGDQLIATSSGNQNSGILTTSLRANAIAILPEGKEFFPAGDVVQVQFLQPDPYLKAADLSRQVA